MARIADDIRHYFTQRGIDVVNADDIRGVVKGEISSLVKSLTRREDFLLDLVTELMWAESNMDRNEKRMRPLLKLQACLREWVEKNKRPELYEEDE